MTRSEPWSLRAQVATLKKSRDQLFLKNKTHPKA